MSSTPDAVSGRADETITNVTVRRAPRYYSFMFLGAVVGAIVALILTTAIPQDPALVKPTDPQYSLAQVFGFLLLVCATIGVALFGLLAWIIDRAALKRRRVVRADRVDVHSSSTAETPPQIEGPSV